MLMEGACEGTKLLDSEGANDGDFDVVVDWLGTGDGDDVVGDKVTMVLTPPLTLGVKSMGFFSLSSLPMDR